ncbi:MAG: protease modulator HflC [candidate division Zixibacteria bacterium]|nr:protease modulator HflC [Candidatus Tariuqbacter arcticus]
MKKSSVIFIIGLIVIIILFALVTFIVDETKQAVILQMGKPVRTVTEPGLHFKLPNPIQTAILFEDRMLDYDASPTEILTKDKKYLIVDNFAKWRIIDPLLFMQGVKDEIGAQARLDDIIYSELRVQLGNHDLSEIVSENREDIMKTVTHDSDKKARDYGIEIIDVRIKRADLAPENETAVYARMRAERERIANQYRSEGEEEALKIRAQTDKEKEIILAEAYREAQITRSEGEALAIEIYANAFEKDPSFYEFMRTMEAYKIFFDEKTTLVLPPEADLFKYFK